MYLCGAPYFCHVSLPRVCAPQPAPLPCLLPVALPSLYPTPVPCACAPVPAPCFRHLHCAYAPRLKSLQSVPVSTPRLHLAHLPRACTWQLCPRVSTPRLCCIPRLCPAPIPHACTARICPKLALGDSARRLYYPAPVTPRLQLAPAPRACTPRLHPALAPRACPLRLQPRL
jgi:hypothetical protein